MRVATYNIKHCGLKGPGEILAVLRRLDADLVGLQEVDVGTRRSGGVDQAAALGSALGFHTAFGEAFPYEGGSYGVALLSRWPIRAAETVALPSLTEPRALLLADVDRPGGTLRAAVTHLGLDPNERIAQTQVVAKHLRDRPRVVLVGDFNAGHSELPLQPLQQFLVDAALHLGVAPLRTYPADAPTIGIDHVLVSPDLPLPRRVEIVPSDASDHLPVTVELG